MDMCSFYYKVQDSEWWRFPFKYTTLSSVDFPVELFREFFFCKNMYFKTYGSYGRCP